MVRYPSCGGQSINHVEVAVDLPYCSGDTTEEKFMPPRLTLDHRSGGMVLEFHQLEVAWDQAQSVKIRLAYDLPHGPSGVVVADCAIEGLVLGDVELGLEAEHRGKRRLRIEIDCEDAKSVKS